ncbi:hypothetical protein V6N11_075560 [Hibiscus sabdariffa]|uniref:Uncharacterized protein n=1 Tax=Hibiscus sabdariffa TaxID=183260 RepID=A0ABR2R778_9ROSI
MLSSNDNGEDQSFNKAMVDFACPSLSKEPRQNPKPEIYLDSSLGDVVVENIQAMSISSSKKRKYIASPTDEFHYSKKIDMFEKIFEGVVELRLGN